MYSPSVVMHQTCLVQWTWNVLLIRDYPGASDECDPRSSHPSYENPLRQRRIPKEKTILRRAMTAWRLEDITPPRMSQEAEEMKEKRKRKAQITFLVPSVKFRHPMLAFRFLNISSVFGAIKHMIILSQSLEPGPPAGLVPTKIDSVPMEIFIPQSRCSFC